MSTIFMNSENSMTSNSMDKMDLLRFDKHVAMPDLNICNPWKNINKC